MTINIQGSLTVATDGVTDYAVAKVVPAITMAGAIIEAGIQIIGTSSEAITFGDVTAPGHIILLNLDAANPVEISFVTPAVADTHITLKAGEFTIFPTRATALYAIATTGNVNLQKIITSL